MTKKSNPCFQCGNTDAGTNTIMYGYTVCATCQSKMGLFKDDTIKKYISSFEKARKKNPKSPSYEQEILHRLDLIEQKYIKGRIKLLHILEQIKRIK